MKPLAMVFAVIMVALLGAGFAISSSAPEGAQAAQGLCEVYEVNESVGQVEREAESIAERSDVTTIELMVEANALCGFPLDHIERDVGDAPEFFVEVG